MQDSIMLDLYASPEQRERFLQPLVAGDVYPWPVWLLVPGAALGATTVGVQAIRRQQRRR